MQYKHRNIRRVVLSSFVALTITGLTFARTIDPPAKPGGETSKAGSESAKSESVSGQTGKVSTLENKSSKTTKGKGKVEKVEFNKLNALERDVILHKGTEMAFRGKYTDHFDEGTYICRYCNAPLYNSTDKFHSGCGWPAFDDEIKGAVHRELESDGTGRIEITCENCGGHLGHVFDGERYTAKNSRHCVNSVSIVFVPKGKELPEVILSPKSLKALEKKNGKPDSKDGKSEKKDKVDHSEKTKPAKGGS